MTYLKISFPLQSGTSYEIAGINGKIAGHVHPGFFKKSLEYKPDESDVILTSYPKCGTTWMQLIVHLLMHDLTPLTRNEQVLLFFHFSYHCISVIEL